MGNSNTNPKPANVSDVERPYTSLLNLNGAFDLPLNRRRSRRNSSSSKYANPDDDATHRQECVIQEVEKKNGTQDDDDKEGFHRSSGSDGK